MNTQGDYPTRAKRAQYKRYTEAQLQWAGQDAWEAVQASAGWNPVGEGYYRDDVATIRAEMRRRGADLRLLAHGRSQVR